MQVASSQPMSPGQVANAARKERSKIRAKVFNQSTTQHKSKSYSQVVQLGADKKHCRFYDSPEKCKYGLKCKFLHSKETTVSKSVVEDFKQTVEESKGDDTSGGDVLSAPPLNFYVKFNLRRSNKIINLANLVDDGDEIPRKLVVYSFAPLDPSVASDRDIKTWSFLHSKFRSYTLEDHLRVREVNAIICEEYLMTSRFSFLELAFLKHSTPAQQLDVIIKQVHIYFNRTEYFPYSFHKFENTRMRSLAREGYAQYSPDAPLDRDFTVISEYAVLLLDQLVKQVVKIQRKYRKHACLEAVEIFQYQPSSNLGCFPFIRGPAHYVMKRFRESFYGVSNQRSAVVYSPNATSNLVYGDANNTSYVHLGGNYESLQYGSKYNSSITLVTRTYYISTLREILSNKLTEHTRRQGQQLLLTVYGSKLPKLDSKAYHQELERMNIAVTYVTQFMERTEALAELRTSAKVRNSLRDLDF